MKKFMTLMVSAALVLTFSQGASAQLGGLMKKGGTDKSADASSSDSSSGSAAGEKPSAETIEKDLKQIIVVTSRALSAFNEALGMKEQAAKAASNADCLEKGQCGVADAVAVVQSAQEATKVAVEGMKSEGKKLSADASKKAVAALVPAIQGIPLWKRVIDGGKALQSDRMAMMKAGALVKALPKVPGAMQGTFATFDAGLSYLSFSGVDGKTLDPLKADLAKSMKGI